MNKAPDVVLIVILALLNFPVYATVFRVMFGSVDNLKDAMVDATNDPRPFWAWTASSADMFNNTMAQGLLAVFAAICVGLVAGECYLLAHYLLKLDIRRVAQDSEASIMADVRRCFPQARIEVVQSGSPLDTSESNPRVHALAQAIEAVSKSPTRFRGEHFASDARYWAAAGVPAVCWGAVGGGIHGDDEWVDVDSLWTCYQVLCRLTGVDP